MLYSLPTKLIEFTNCRERRNVSITGLCRTGSVGQCNEGDILINFYRLLSDAVYYLKEMSVGSLYFM